MPAAGSRAQQFLEALEREVARSRRVLAAFPAGRDDFQPHPESGKARDIAWKISMGLSLMVKALTTGFDWSKPPGKSPEPPASLAEISKAMDAEHARVVGTLRGVDEPALDETVQFPVGPKQIGDHKKIDFLWFLLFDHVHHRGQLSVYLRLVGAKVPAIYGPSGDERWF